MATYTPMRTPLKAMLQEVRILSMRWRDDAFSADFAGPQGQFMRAGFEKPIIVRAVDGIPVPRLEQSLMEGASARFFAYEVFGSPFFLDHIEGLVGERELAKHYRFITQSKFLDVVSVHPPAMRVLSEVKEG